MKITKSLVKRLCELGLDSKHSVESTFVEKDVRDYAGKALAEGRLGFEEMAKLSSEEEVSELNSLVSKCVAEAMAPVTNALATITKSIGEMATKGVVVGGGVTEGTGTASPTDIGKAGELVGKGLSLQGQGQGQGQGSGGEDPTAIRIKSVKERFDNTRQPLSYNDSRNVRYQKSFGSSQVCAPSGIGHRVLEKPSDLDKAVGGAWLKHLINRQCKAEGRPVPNCFKMNDLDRDLIVYAAHECKFMGPVGQTSEDSDTATYGFLEGTRATPVQIKALLDDATSGGLEAVPIEFDGLAITTPLLNGELFPNVNITTVNRRRIEGFQIGNVTFSNTAEGTAVTPFTTTAFVAAFDTTIYPIVGAMEIGLDFLEDAPVNMGQLVNERYSEAFLAKMDDLIANGSGTNEVLGLVNTSGLTSVTSANGATGPHTVGDYEGLLFGVGKAFRNQAGAARSVFLSNDTAYRRRCSIQVGASDQRRVFGMDLEAYQTFGHAHKINNTLANTKAGFFCLNRFRLYRRAGVSVRVETAGKTLTLANQQLVYVRARFGGQLELGAAGAICTTLQT